MADQSPRVDRLSKQQFFTQVGHRFSRCEQPVRHPEHPWRATTPRTGDSGWWWCGGDPVTLYGVRGGDPGNTVVTFPDEQAASDARVSDDDVVVISRDEGRHWATLEQDRTNRRCGCCGPLDLGPCSCVTFCGVIRCSQVGEAESIINSPLYILVQHQLRTDESGKRECQCGDDSDGSPVAHAKHIVDQLIRGGFGIHHKDGHTEKPLEL